MCDTTASRWSAATDTGDPSYVGYYSSNPDMRHFCPLCDFRLQGESSYRVFLSQFKGDLGSFARAPASQMRDTGPSRLNVGWTFLQKSGTLFRFRRRPATDNHRHHFFFNCGKKTITIIGHCWIENKRSSPVRVGNDARMVVVGEISSRLFLFFHQFSSRIVAKISNVCSACYQ